MPDLAAGARRFGHLALFWSAVASAADPSQAIDTERAKVRLETVAGGLERPWGLAFLPDGRALVTEKPGRLRIVARDGKLSEPVKGVPEVDPEGQGGLLDVTIDPDFAKNATIFLSYAEPRGDGKNGTSVARARLGAEGLEDLRVIFRQQPALAGGHHFGSRLVFGRDGALFVTLGDRNRGRDQVQQLDNHIGKVVRVATDGSVPADNPYVGKAGARPELWSLGHRNVQGAALHPGTGEVWMVEHGPQGGDEVNVVEGGRNYGWPLLTHGRNYGTGTRIGEEGPRPGFEQPIKWWVPSIAPSGMVFVSSDRYPGWKGSLLVGALRGQILARLTLDGRKVVAEERLLQNLGERIRDVRQGPDGYIYIVTDSADGKVLRLLP